MRWSQPFIVLTAALVLAAATWLNGQQRRPAGQVGLSVEDYTEIQQLYGLYARDIDSGSIRDASWTFTSDGALQVDGTTRTGQALRDRLAALRADRQNGVRQFTSTYVIVRTSEGARGSAYTVEVERQAQRGQVQIVSYGKYEDRLVRTRDGWRFKERIWTPDTYRGSTAPVTPSPIPGR